MWRPGKVTCEWDVTIECFLCYLIMYLIQFNIKEMGADDIIKKLCLLQVPPILVVIILQWPLRNCGSAFSSRFLQGIATDEAPKTVVTTYTMCSETYWQLVSLITPESPYIYKE